MSEDPVPARRLGKRELGRHAFEKRMPDRVQALIATETPRNCLAGVLPVLARLLERDSKVAKVYLCDESVEHVYRVKGEGDHFCGYRNIQMLASSLSSDSGSSMLRVRPRYTIVELQAMIEKGWEAGINSEGSVETGGIRNTRKHIGTAEAQTFFSSLQVDCHANAFSNVENTKTAYQDLLDFVERYFSSIIATVASTDVKIHCTALSPIYLQRPRHSLTIVGFERRHNGSRSLLVFDPAYSPPKDLIRALAAGSDVKRPKSIVKAYRRDEKYLKRYGGFETLHLGSR